MSQAYGTCVIGELTNQSAFASIECDGAVWAKRYANLEDAVDENRRMGLIDGLFAVAATRYVRQTRGHCVTPLQRKASSKKLASAGFRQAGKEGRGA